MRKRIVFKTVSLTLIITCFFSLCLRDLSLAFTATVPYSISLPSITSTTSYDSLGRVTQARNGLNQVTVTYSYPDFNTKVTTNAIGLSASEYIDGLGRKYKSVSSGEDGDSARKVVSEAFFNARGLSEKEALAHYLDEEESQISYLRYEYDLRGRVKKTSSDFPGTLKDAESSINYISPLYTETTDPMGHKKGTLKDVFGNIIEVTEFTQGGVYKTKYEYDIQRSRRQFTLLSCS